MVKTKVMRKGSSSWGAISAAGLLLFLLALSSSPAGASNDLGRFRTAAGHAGILRLRGGVSKYYNHTAPPRRAGIFEDTGGLPPVTITSPTSPPYLSLSVQVASKILRPAPPCVASLNGFGRGRDRGKG